ncbi:glycosyltransferase family 2 protein [Virgibacillus ainsalahensis]
MLKKIISAPMDWVLYTLLDERKRKKIGDQFSDQQKDKLKRIINGKKFIQRQQLKQLKHHLYNLGFTERALAEMEAFLETIDNEEIKRLVAWELTLWHANKYSAEGARQALTYIPIASRNERNMDQLRRIAIITAECLERLDEIEKAKNVIAKVLEKQPHPDLYLAAVNLEEAVDNRVEWINKALDLYNLQHISFATKGNAATYDDLITNPLDKKIEADPKVSVILPAFKAEFGIRIAIESILSQTWQNLELLVVDDCSPDKTKETVKEYTQKDSRVKLLQTPVNSGPYVARNIAMQEATGDFVTINDADDWSHAEKIETQVRHLVENPEVIANTSEHARLTEGLKLYRRGTPGKYIFPNMSSIMFRREPVLEKIGYWDSMRFAADGEFKRRLLRVFGKNSYVDLKSGPLSLPRQSVSSLTGSSAFGYNGFFMGVRKEYVEGLEFHHNNTDSLYYPYPLETRPFPVPEPMWPNRERKTDGQRHFDIVLAGDFRQNVSAIVKEINTLKTENIRIGLMQLYQYDLTITENLHPDIRRLLDGDQVQMLVYGEKITADILLLFDPSLLETWQKYRPTITAEEVNVMVLKLPDAQKKETILNHMKEYVGSVGIWYPVNNIIRESLQEWGVPLAEKIRSGDDGLSGE